MDLSVPKPTRDGFQSNLDKLAKCKRQLSDIQLKLQEPGIDRDKVNAKKNEITQNWNVMIGIVARQFTTDIWKPATPQFVKKAKELKDLEFEYSRLSGITRKERKNEEL